MEFFDQTRLRELHARQVEAVRYVDGVFSRLFDLLPDDTWVRELPFVEGIVS